MAAYRTDAVVEAAMMLRERAPENWDHFTQVVRALAAQTSLDLLKAAPDALVNAQGRAQAIQEFSQLLTDVTKHFENIRARRATQ